MISEEFLTRVVRKVCLEMDKQASLKAELSEIEEKLSDIQRDVLDLEFPCEYYTLGGRILIGDAKTDCEYFRFRYNEGGRCKKARVGYFRSGDCSYVRSGICPYGVLEENVHIKGVLSDLQRRQERILLEKKNLLEELNGSGAK